MMQDAERGFVTPRGEQLLKRWLSPLLIILTGVVAYWNSFDGVFLYDDLASIRDNPHIRVLRPLSESLSLPLWNSGVTVDGRPLLSLSFALNHRFLGPDPGGYHLVNLLIHIAAALLLFGIVRRTLDLPRFRERQAGGGTWLALATALIWMVHPLQTESVTYIVQRAESLMGMLFLLTLYSAIRGFTSTRRVPWYVAAVVACVCGMGVKEIMFSAPLLVLLYDGLFISPSLCAPLAKRKWLYVALFASWSIVFWITYAGWAEATGYFAEISPLRYALTQPLVLLYYLRLAVWPSPLVLSYAWALEDQWPRIVFPALAVMGLLAVMGRGLWRREWYGFVAAWFFLILGPTSTIVPMQQAIFEHRLYLSLAALVVLAVLGGDRAIRTLFTEPKRRAVLGGGLVTLAVVVCVCLTHDRNRDYHSELGLWQQNIAYQPGNAMVRYSLGNALRALGREREAVAQYEQAVRIDPDYADAHNNLGNALLALGRPGAAIPHYRALLRLQPGAADTHFNLGIALEAGGKPLEAIMHYEEAVRIRPDLSGAQYNLGNALQAAGRPEEAVPHYREVLRIQPDNAKAHNNLGNALLALGRPREAVVPFEQALRIEPGSAETHFNAGVALEAAGRPREAAAHYRQAVRIRPGLVEAHFNLGNVLLASGRSGDAIASYLRALRLKPDHAEAHNNLGAVYKAGGRFTEAIRHFEQALRVKPDYAVARENLQQAKALMKAGSE